MKLNDYLKTSRSEANLTQAHVARSLGYSSAQFVSNWETSQSTPPENVLSSIAKMYNVPVSDLAQHFLDLKVIQFEKYKTKFIKKYKIK